MRRRHFLYGLGAAAAWPLAARAQTRPARPVIGYLHSRGPEDSKHLVAGFRRGLRDGGFIEGQDVTIEYRWAHGQFDRLPALAQELSRVPVSLMLAGGGVPAPVAAKGATSTIPIIFVMGGDPVELGLAASYNRPGANITGIAVFTISLDPKRIGLLRDLVPGADTIGYLVNSTFSPVAQQVAAAEAAVRTLGVRLRVLRAANEREIDAAFETIGKENIRALSVAGSPYFDTRQRQIIDLASKYNVPAIYHFREYAVSGGLISYGIDIVDAYRQGGLYASQILNGAKPAEMPVLQPTKFDLVINLKTAKALGLAIPPGVLAIADDVIE